MKRTLGAFRGTTRAQWLVTVAAASMLFAGAPANAQDANTNLRLNKVEAEVRALQRKVFPGSDGKFFEPQISATPAPAPVPGAPSTTPLSDVLTRMDSIEAQMAQLTAQVEQNTNRIGQLEAKLAAAAPAPQSDFVPGPAAAPAPATSSPAPAVTPTPVAATPRPAPAPVAAKPAAPSNSRIDGVKAIVKPQSADPGDDEYSYGFRLWEAKYYPEAQQQLKLFLEKYPKHARASFGRNLLGRAYLDDGNPGEAAKWFLQNFQADKRGDRASDSLLYLAVSMKQLKDTKRACIALAEFSETYAAEAAGRLAGLYNTTRNGLACS
ncbi:tetratricopeptide repeat protein [Novosphingobium guangzhouense]|uniref:YbgF trimerisation domain-containing protein n=1 Tax=Novosphingobium guangzhouense TaxID=1850347 RepID=A0A2K2FUT4_9SPHN|nr:hypothetical protein [Novosphingobium guangzhouense]PNU02543.1 hypothetical protein A8V01_09205 [Novosphingobium guangzhouense]